MWKCLSDSTIGSLVDVLESLDLGSNLRFISMMWVMCGFNVLDEAEKKPTGSCCAVVGPLATTPRGQ